MQLKKFLLFGLLIFACIITVSLTGCSKKDKSERDIVAKINNNYVITFNDLRQYVFNGFYNKKYTDINEAYNKALDALITDQLKRFDFFNKGLNKDAKLIQNIRRIINEELVNEYFMTQFLGKYANEDYARKIYGSMDKEIYYKQIILKKPDNASENQINLIEQNAMNIKSKVDKGEDFSKLAEKYSHQSPSLSSNGYIQSIGWEQSISNPIDNIIFKLNTGDVKVLNAYDGFHIVKITDIKKIDLEPFDKIKNEIITKLKKGYYDASLKEYYDQKEKLIDESSLKWNELALNQLVKWSKIPDFYTKIYKDILRKAITDNKDFTILTYSEGSVDLKEYLRLLNNVLVLKYDKNINKDDIKKFLLEAIRTDKIVSKAENLGLEKNIFNPQTNNPDLKIQIASLYDQAVVDSQIPKPTDEVLHKFYDEQKDSLYYQLKKINIYAMTFSDEKKAEEVMQRIKTGTPFEKISGDWYVKTFIRDRDGNIKSYFSRERPFLGKSAFKLKLNETAGPVEYNDPEKGEQYAIIKCVNIRPEKQLLFDDVKNSIAGDFRNYQREKLLKEVKAYLWKKYDVKIYKDVISGMLKSN